MPWAAQQPGAQVGHRNPGADRTASGLPGNAHQPAHSLGNLVIAGTVLIRSVCPKPEMLA